MKKEQRKPTPTWTKPRRIDLSLQEIIADLRYPEADRSEPGRRLTGRRRVFFG